MRKELEKEIESLKSPEGYLYACLPKFRGLFGRDALISGWELLDYDSSLLKNSLLALAKLQGKKVDLKTGEEPGKILHEFYPSYTPEKWFKRKKGANGWLKKERPFYFSVDSTPLFLIAAHKYYLVTKDGETIKSLWPNIESALSWIFNYGLINGFIRYKERSKETGLVSQSWKDGIGNTLEQQKGPIAVVEVQGYAYEAVKVAERLMKLAGNKKLAYQANEFNQTLKERFNKDFWMKDKKFYCLALDGDNQQLKFVTSNPGQLLFTDIINNRMAKLIVQRLFQDDLWTPYGIRTDSTEETDFDPLAYQQGSVWPHDNWLIAKGLKKRGYKKEYRAIKASLLRAYREIGFIPEYYGVSRKNKIILAELKTPPCYPQAWSSGALIDFLESEQRTLFSKMIERSKETLRMKRPLRA